MFPESKNKMRESFKPSASLKNLRYRAEILKLVRDFFLARNIMEVETPLIGHTSVTDPFIESIPVIIKKANDKEEHFYLQTSPEYAMKRLLASGCGAIYQITKAFRQGEIGKHHQPEFTMIEWYRPDYDHHQLMDEVDELLQLILKTPKAIKKTYADLFLSFLSIDPHQVGLLELINVAKAHHINVAGESTITDKESWLDILMTSVILPQLDETHPYFIYDFPASLAALARIQPKDPPVASRFEVYFRGTELANGFHELKDAQEQRRRFEKNLMERKARNLQAIAIDELFLASLPYLPDCSGVALGLDRLIMQAIQSDDISDVISFDFR
jgi:lysyl-tRNA synthetase class 2